MPNPYLLDCDTGIDDALALAWLATHPEVDLVGVTSIFGNVNTRQAARNSCDLLALLGRADVPVTAGPDTGMGPRHGEDVAYIHGVNGIGDVQLPRADRDPDPDESSPEMIVRLAREHAGELHIVAIGPLTNLGLALDLDPELPSLVKQVTTMGGTALAPGNGTPRTDANTANDFVAAAKVYAAPWDLTMVGLDVTMQNVMEEEQQQRLLDAPHEAVRAIAQMLPIYFDFYSSVVFDRRVCAMHDPLAAAIATGDIVPSLAPRVRGYVDLSPGPEQGATIIDMRPRYRHFTPEPEDANFRVVLECGTTFAEMLTERLLRL